MLRFLFAIIVLVAGVKCDPDVSEDCQLSPHQACPVDHLPPDMPGNAEELDEACNLGIPRFECETDYFGKCHPDSPVYQNMLNALPVVRDICDKDNLLHDVIANSLPCLKENKMEITQCANSPFKDLDEAYEKLIEAQGIEGVSKEETECLVIVSRLACGIATAGQLCGEPIKDAIVEILQRVTAPLDTCPPVVREHLPVIVDTFILQRGQEEAVANALEEK